MARFMIKASEFKNICKAVNDRKLAELKKEIIEILKKQDEKEVKKAIDYFNSQELHYTHLEKSFNGKWIEKAGFGIGTVRIWKGKKYKKIAPGKWARVFEKEGRGTNIAIGKLIAKVQKIDNVEDLMAFVMANKQRFVDENGVDLPVLDKLRAAVDARNGNVGSKEQKYKDENELFIKEKIQQFTEIMKDEKPSLDRLKMMKQKQESALKAAKEEEPSDGSKGRIKIAEEKLKIIKQEIDEITSKPAEKKSAEEYLKEMGFETMEKVSFNGDKWEVAGVTFDYKGNPNGISLTPDRDAGNLKSSNVTVFDINKIKKAEKPVKSKKESKEDLEAALKEVEDAIDNAGDYDDIEELENERQKLLKKFGKEEKPADTKESDSERLKRKAEDNYGDWSKKDLESELKNLKEKEKEGFNVSDDREQINYILENKDFDEEKETYWIQDNRGNRLTNEDAKKRLMADIENLKEYKNEYLLERLNPEDRKEIESEFEKTKNRSDAMKGNKNAYKGGYTPSESTNLKTKKAIAENKSIGENEVQMPYSKELAVEIEGLKNCTSKDLTRELLTKVYYKDGNLIATDARRLKTVKVGKLDGLEDGTYVDIDVSRNGINIKKNDFDGIFPNYSRVIPDNLSQKVTLDNDVLKQKLKDMRKDGAIDKKGLNMVQLEFKDGKVYLDDTEVGKADIKELTINTGTWTQPNDEKTNYIAFNADYLENALNGKNSVMMLSNNADKAVGISTDSTVNVIMPFQMHDNATQKYDYSENRKKKADEQAKKADNLQKNRRYNEELIKTSLSGEKFDKLQDKVYSTIDDKIKEFSDDELKRNYDIMNLNMDKIMDRSVRMLSDKVDKKTGASFQIAYAYSKLKENHPDVMDKFREEFKNRGIEIKKSLFDDFIIDNFIEEDIDDMEEDEEERSLWNDYSAEQPELFNSTELMVSEAMCRCNL